MGNGRINGAIWVNYPYGWGEQGVFADVAHEADEKPTHSQILGPDGQPLKYEQSPRLGFDLSPRKRGA